MLEVGPPLAPRHALLRAPQGTSASPESFLPGGNSAKIGQLCQEGAGEMPDENSPRALPNTKIPTGMFLLLLLAPFNLDMD